MVTPPNHTSGFSLANCNLVDQQKLDVFPLLPQKSPCFNTNEYGVIVRALAQRSISPVLTIVRSEQRMKGDPEYGEAVNRLRKRDCTDQDVDLFNSRLVHSASNPGGVDMSCAENENATAVVMTNESREVLNLHKAMTASGELLPLERRHLLQLNVTAIRSSQALPGQLALFEGMPVVLRVRNLSTELGVTNGSQGFIRKIYTSTIPGGFVYTPCVLVEFPDSRLEIHEHAIRTHTPGCGNLVRGLLYATAADSPFVVDVPLDYGRDVVNDFTDLNVNGWVQQRETNSVVNTRRSLRITRDFVLNSDVPLQHGHTIFIESDLVFPAPNALIKRLLWKKGRRHEHEGNVLVIKHDRGNEGRVVDMTEEDISFCNFLLRSMMHIRSEWCPY